MTSIEIRLLKDDELSSWDNLVSNSVGGTFFHKMLWLKQSAKLSNKKLNVVGFVKSNSILGGCPLYISTLNKLFKIGATNEYMSPYGGFVFKRKLKKKKYPSILSKFSDYISKQNFDYLSIISSPEILDMRSFSWDNTFSSKVYYTYLLNLTEEISISRDARRNIKKATEAKIKIEKSEDILLFYKLLTQTFRAQKLPVPIRKEDLCKIFKTLIKNNGGEMWIAKTKEGKAIAAEIFTYDSKRAYRWSAATHPYLKGGAYYLLLYIVLNNFKQRGFGEFDLLGANIPQLSKFITSFNPQLRPYFNIQQYSLKFRILRNLKFLNKSKN